jgi:hypothetical protein
MRLWSIHPKYLDSIGLIALWRESLLAKAVLEQKTKGYTSHPQLIRFRNNNKPINAINCYLQFVLEEANSRDYKFDKTKINSKLKFEGKLKITDKQLEYEFQHLLKKLKTRCPSKYKELKTIKKIKPNPIFTIVRGNIANWEKIQ